MKASSAFEPENNRESILLALGEVFNSRINDKYAEEYTYQKAAEEARQTIEEMEEDEEFLEDLLFETRKLLRVEALVQYAVDCGINYNEAVLLVGYPFDDAYNEVTLEAISSSLFEYFGKRASFLSAFNLENILRNINVSEVNQEWVSGLKHLIDRKVNPKYDLNKTLDYIEEHRNDAEEDELTTERKVKSAKFFAVKLRTIQTFIDVGMSYTNAISSVALGLGGISSASRMEEAYGEILEIARDYAARMEQAEKEIEEMKKRGEIIDD